MRRLGQDVFEIGDEQLLDEPAVQLASHSDPDEPLSSLGCDQEAAGVESEPDSGPAGIGSGAARPPRRLHAATAPRVLAGLAGIAVAGSVAALTLRGGADREPAPVARSSDTLEASDEQPEAETPRRRGRKRPARKRGRGPSPQRERRRVANVRPAAPPAPPEDASTEPAAHSAAAAPLVPATRETTSTSVAGTDGEGASGSAMTRREIVAREFGP